MTWERDAFPPARDVKLFRRRREPRRIRLEELLKLIAEELEIPPDMVPE